MIFISAADEARHKYDEADKEVRELESEQRFVCCFFTISGLT